MLVTWAPGHFYAFGVEIDIPADVSAAFPGTRSSFDRVMNKSLMNKLLVNTADVQPALRRTSRGMQALTLSVGRSDNEPTLTNC